MGRERGEPRGQGDGGKRAPLLIFIEPPLFIEHICTRTCFFFGPYIASFSSPYVRIDSLAGLRPGPAMA